MSDLKDLADMADAYGKKLSISAAGMRDEVALKMGEDIADQVVLNAIIEQLAFVTAGVIADRRGEKLDTTIRNDLDGIRKNIHKFMAQLLHDKTGKSFFIEIDPRG